MLGDTHQAAGMLKINNESGKTTRRAAFFFMKALDHQLTVIGGGLSTFKVDNLVPLLKPGQKRYFQPRKRKLDGVPAHVTQRKSCVWDTETKRAIGTSPIGW